ncbi:hypothetical protein Pint_13964 [Pistacia integerrima]|uniref:Uncharacterized protein n=1 Tax=Pistacia integerrima TaxID=434235 RepID=A0ACC0Y7I9_9ROSI|nr:hypothetical protein Pint_13964 [Pistacia integerrima]
MAPVTLSTKYGRERKVSTSGDVYSYGIMLMETFAGKKPTDEIFFGEMKLKHWVTEALPGSITEVLDTNLLRREDENFAGKEQCHLS